MRRNPPWPVRAAVALLFVGGCESFADREYAAALRDEQRRAAESRRREQEPLPLWPDYPAACPVHRSALRDDLVPVVYGTPGHTPEGLEYLDAQPRMFPYASGVVRIGFGGGPRQARVKYCPDCRAAAALSARDANRRMVKRLVREFLPEEFVLAVAAEHAALGAIVPGPFIAAMRLNPRVHAGEPREDEWDAGRQPPRGAAEESYKAPPD